MRLYGIDRLILGLALACALLFGLLRLDRTGDPPLSTMAGESVQEIRAYDHGRLRLALLRDSEGWMLTHPEIARARPARVATLLALLRAPVRNVWPVDPELLTQAGLDEPVRELRFDRLRVRFGGPSSPPGRRYVRIEDRVVLIDDFWFDLAGLPARHFREAE